VGLVKGMLHINGVADMELTGVSREFILAYARLQVPEHPNATIAVRMADGATVDAYDDFKCIPEELIETCIIKQCPKDIHPVKRQIDEAYRCRLIITDENGNVITDEVCW